MCFLPFQVWISACLSLDVWLYTQIFEETLRFITFYCIVLLWIYRMLQFSSEKWVFYISYRPHRAAVSLCASGLLLRIFSPSTFKSMNVFVALLSDFSAVKVQHDATQTVCVASCDQHSCLSSSTNIQLYGPKSKNGMKLRWSSACKNINVAADEFYWSRLCFLPNTQICFYYHSFMKSNISCL